MKILMVARDAAPSRCFEMVKLGISNEHKVFSFLGHGKPIQGPIEYIIWHAKNSDIILLGMSSSLELSKEERFAADCAIEKNIPYGFYADTYGTIKRIWFKKYRDKASFLFVINEKEAEEAKSLYPNAEIVISGNPLWDDFFFQAQTYEDVRKKISVSADEKMILCPGGKNLTVNILHFGGVIEAVNFLKNKYKFKIMLLLHPGDLNNGNVYNDLAKYSKFPVSIADKEITSSSELIIACDLVIESASSIGIEAACKRKPVIDYFTEIALARKEEEGSKDWELCKLGVALPVYGEKYTLATFIDLFCAGKIQKDLLISQENNFPAPPKKGAAVRKIIETLLQK